MFDLFRSQRKSVKYVLSFLLAMVGVSMVITLVPGLFSTPTMDLSNPVLVEVGDEPITIQDVELEVSQMVQPGQDISQLRGTLASQALESLITEKVMFEEADRLGLKPNDRQLAEWIRDQMPTLFQDGQFNSAQYATLVQQRFNMTVPEFERRLLADVTVQGRLLAMITDSVVVTDADLRAAYAERNRTARIAYVGVPSGPFANQVDMSEEKIAEFFNSNRFRYRTTETRSVKYIPLTPQELPPGPEISDAEIRNFYDQYRYRFETPDRIHPRHILFMTVNPETGASLSDAEKDAKKALAEDVLKQLKDGGDFAALASKYSEDPGTKDQGGDLGWITSGQMGTAAFENAAFALQPGEISGVVETEYGYHIIQMQERESAQRKPLEEVRDEIFRDIQAERQATAQQQQEDSAMAALRNATPQNVDEVAQSLGFSVQSFPNFERNTAPPPLARQTTVLSSIFSGSVGEVIPSVDGQSMSVVMITEITPARDMTYEEAKDRVRRDYASAEARSMAQARAGELADKAKESSLAEAAAEFGLQVQESQPFSPSGSGVPGFGTSDTLHAAFITQPGDIVGPIPTAFGFGVYTAIEVKEADMSGYADQRSSLHDELLNARKAEAFQIFRDDTVARYQQEGLIHRYEGRIQQFMDSVSRPML